MSWFPFLQFTLHQQKCGQRLGTDSMLLGAWTACEQSQTILDIGTGSGVLALMLAQRAQQALIDAIEPDGPSAEQAGENVASSPWPQRIHVHQARLQDWRPAGRYDLLICNPPYFDESTRAGSHARHQARHTDGLGRQELLEHAQRLLRPTGRLALVLPLRPSEAFIQRAEASSWQLRRQCRIRHSPAHPPSRLLLDLVHPAAAADRPPARLEELVIRGEDGKYSPTYLELTQSYHTPAPPKGFSRRQA